MWTVEVPENSVSVELDEGEAQLHFRKLHTVFDAFTVPNSLSANRPLGFVGATIDSLRINWEGIMRRVSFSNATTRFAGQYVENAATIELTVHTPATRPPFTPTAQHGFRFVGDPATTRTNFAQIGHERNGIFFPV